MARPELRDRIRGAHVVMVTPFKSGRELDEDALRAHVRFLVGHGIVRGNGVLVPGGSMGECHAMRLAERKRLLEVVIEEAAGRVPVIPGCNDTGTDKVIELCEHALACGADGVMITPPYYWTPDDVTIFKHFEAISSAVDIPIMVYNNEIVVRKDLSMELLDRLADIPNVAWLKQCTPSFARLRRTVELLGDRVGVVNCWGLLFEPHAYEIGCVGFISDEANFAPEMAVSLHQALVAGNVDECREIYQKLRRLVQFIWTREWPARICSLKRGVELRGLSAGSCMRLPVYRYTAAEDAEFIEILRELQLTSLEDRDQERS